MIQLLISGAYKQFHAKMIADTLLSTKHDLRLAYPTNELMMKCERLSSIYEYQDDSYLDLWEQEIFKEKFSLFGEEGEFLFEYDHEKNLWLVSDDIEYQNWIEYMYDGEGENMTYHTGNICIIPSVV